MNAVQVVGKLDSKVERVGFLVGDGSLGLGSDQMPMELMRNENLDVMVCGEILEWDPISVKIIQPEIVGSTDQDKLQVIPIVGGTFTGAKINGTVVPGGADWNTTEAGDRKCH